VLKLVFQEILNDLNDCKPWRLWNTINFGVRRLEQLRTAWRKRIAHRSGCATLATINTSFYQMNQSSSMRANTFWLPVIHTGFQFGILSGALCIPCAHCCIPGICVPIQGHMVGIRCANTRCYKVLLHRIGSSLCDSCAPIPTDPGRWHTGFQRYPVCQLLEKAGFFNAMLRFVGNLNF
jgi:hypothetical protein